jgi:hypothetical protein
MGALVVETKDRMVAVLLAGLAVVGEATIRVMLLPRVLRSHILLVVTVLPET